MSHEDKGDKIDNNPLIQISGCATFKKIPQIRLDYI